MKKEEFIPLQTQKLSEKEVIAKSENYYKKISKRRSVRDFSDKEIPREVIESILKAAGSAPSGANKQPWTFCVISNTELKSEIRKLAERQDSYQLNSEKLDYILQLYKNKKIFI